MRAIPDLRGRRAEGMTQKPARRSIPAAVAFASGMHPARSTILTGGYKVSKEAQAAVDVDKEAEKQEAAWAERKARLAAFRALPEEDRALQQAIWGIQYLKRHGAQDALKKIRRELERQGTRRGPKSANYARWKIETLKNRAKRIPWKTAVTCSMEVKIADREIRKYCLKFYRFCQSSKLTPDDWQRLPSWYGDLELLRRMFGFELPQDSDALIEAYRQGKKLVDARSSSS